MIRKFYIVGFILALVAFTKPLIAQVDQRLGPPIAMNIQPPMVSGEFVKIPYDIPYDGYIIFNLFTPEGKKIWTATAVKEKGTYVQVFKREPLEEGAQYLFEFYYKGKNYSGKFTNN